MDKSEGLALAPMPDTNGLPDLEQRVLLAIWRLKGIGKNEVDENSLNTEFPNETGQVLTAIRALTNQGFIEQTDSGNRKGLSLTPLGLAILRKLEEDRLQELK
jgi:predicted transcriptional regulator